MDRKNYASSKGRGTDKFIQLHHSFFRTQAWRALKTGERALYWEIELRFNGYNNGDIAFSVRDAATALNVSANTVVKYFWGLQKKGFIKVSRRSSFSTDKGRLATTYILTRHPFREKMPDRDFDKWKTSADDFSVVSGLASHQKKKRTKRQSQNSSPTVAKIATGNSDRSKKMGPTITNIGTKFTVEHGGDSHKNFDTYNIPSREAETAWVEFFDKHPILNVVYNEEYEAINSRWFPIPCLLLHSTFRDAA